LNPDISAIVSRYSSHTSKNPVLPPSVEVQPNAMMMPLEPESFGAQIALMHNHVDIDLNHPHKVLSSGCIIQDPTEGTKSHANQSYPSSHDFAHNNSISSGYVTHNSHMATNSTPFMLPYPALSLENPQGNSDYQEHCEICIREHQCTCDEIYAYEHQPLSEGKVLPSPKLSNQGIPAYPNIPEFRGKTISADDQQKNGSTDYLSLPDFGIDFEDDMGVDMSDPRQRHTIGDERNTMISENSVFSRIQPPSQEAMGPTLNQLVSSFSQKAEKWSNENGPVVGGVSYMTREQDTDRPYSHSELNLPSKLELEAEAGESTESQPPFLNFKRRSKARNVDTNLGKEISGKVKRRKLVRPSFEENSAATCSGTCKPEMKYNQQKVGGNHFDIDLNTPAISDSDPTEKDNSIELFPSVLTKIQTEKLCEVDTNKTNSSNVLEAVKEQVPSFNNAAPAKRVSFDIDISELKDKSKLQTLLQALGKFASAKSKSFEEARSSIPGEL
jgi:hypothetical protein